MCRVRRRSKTATTRCVPFFNSPWHHRGYARWFRGGALFSERSILLAMALCPHRLVCVAVAALVSQTKKDGMDNFYQNLMHNNVSMGNMVDKPVEQVGAPSIWTSPCSNCRLPPMAMAPITSGRQACRAGRAHTCSQPALNPLLVNPPALDRPNRRPLPVRIGPPGNVRVCCAAMGAGGGGRGERGRPPGTAPTYWLLPRRPKGED